MCTVKGGGAKKADDKVFQHNGAGELKITNFDVSDFGKLYRSCGNCKYVILGSPQNDGLNRI